jgi:hypothetical protein
VIPANIYIKKKMPEKNMKGCNIILTKNTFKSYAYNGPNKDINSPIPQRRYRNIQRGN